MDKSQVFHIIGIFSTPDSHLKIKMTSPAPLILKKYDQKFREKFRLPRSEYFLVSVKDSAELLIQLSKQGTFIFKEKRLICDVLGRTDFTLFVESFDEDLLIQGLFQWRDKKVNLEDCDLICVCPHAWFIKGPSLKILREGIDLKWLKRLLGSGHELLSGKEKEGFLFQARDEDEWTGPDIQWGEVSESTPPPKQEVAVWPLLRLKDRSGAFADLWMDYGSDVLISFNDPRMRVPHPQFGRNFRRLESAEQSWEADFLETGFEKKFVGNSHYHCPVDQVPKALSFLLDLGWRIEDHEGNTVSKPKSMHLSVSTSSDGFLVKGKMQFDEYEMDIQNVSGVFNRRERFIDLGPGKVALLEGKDLDQLEVLAEDGEVLSDGVNLPKSHLGSLEELMGKDLEVDLDQAAKDLLHTFSSVKAVSPVEPGKGFQGTLRPYQQEGLEWLVWLDQNGLQGILADDMGLGKTVQVLAFLSQIALDRPVLIILPTSLIFNWKNEFQTFLPEVDVYIHHGPDRLRRTEDLVSKQIILSSYGVLRRDIHFLSPVHFRAVILDEAQVIKNDQTKVAQCMYQLQADFRLSLSGTPVENRLEELWAQFRFLTPGLLGTKVEFESNVSGAALDSRYLKRIQRRIAPFFMRRTKDKVASDLPPKVEQTVWIEMGAEQRKVYEDFLQGYRQGLLKKVQVDGMGKHRMEVFEAILRLRQICCHPLLVSSLLPEESVLDSDKFRSVLGDLQTVVGEGGKVILYSQFTSLLKLFKKELSQLGISFVYLDGSTSNREVPVGEFQNNPNIKVFLMSLKAGGIGLNLTAADYVFIYDPWWNEAAEMQAIDRAHRIGRKGSVLAKRYVVRDSIEEKVVKLKSMKQDLIHQVLTDEWDPSLITEQDLESLFS